MHDSNWRQEMDWGLLDVDGGVPRKDVYARLVDCPIIPEPFRHMLQI